MHGWLRQLTFALLRTTLLLSAVLLTTACTPEKKTPEPEATCTPECNDRCSGSDGCGGECRCDADPACAKCAPHESCVAGTCVCNPSCAGTACGPDGCGGTCPCPDDYVQNAEGEWVPRESCQDTCAEAGWACGELCGQKCGSCEGAAACELGTCGCAPQCDGSRCDDGCGGRCDCGSGNVCNPSGVCVPESQCTDTCASLTASCGEVCGQACGSCGDSQVCAAGKCLEGTTCTTCSTTLRLIDKRVVDGRIVEVTLAIEYTPNDTEPRPRVADFRIKADHPVQLLEASVGPAVEEAGKALYVDQATGKPWRVRADGSFQLLAYGVGNSQTFTTGRAVTLRIGVGSTSPVAFTLLRREQIYAPPPADIALQATAYDRQLVVSP
jgi:hypothetical protein